MASKSSKRGLTTGTGGVFTYKVIFIPSFFLPSPPLLNFLLLQPPAPLLLRCLHCLHKLLLLPGCWPTLDTNDKFWPRKGGLAIMTAITSYGRGKEGPVTTTACFMQQLSIAQRVESTTSWLFKLFLKTRVSHWIYYNLYQEMIAFVRSYF